MNGRLALLVMWFLAVYLDPSAAVATPEFRPVDGPVTTQFQLQAVRGETLGHETLGHEILQRDGFSLREVTAKQLSGRIEKFTLSTDSGSGADALNLTLVQTRFRNTPCIFADTCQAGPCNTLDILWRETTPNVLGLNLFIDGVLFGTIPGAGQLPVNRGAELGGFSAGEHTIALQEIRAAGVEPAPLVEASMVVLDDQPFDDPANAQCIDESVAANGTCTLTLDFENPSPPDGYTVFFDRATAGLVRGTASRVSFNGVIPDEYVISLAGFLSNVDGNYEGCPVEFTCSTQCARTAACQPPVRLTLIQTAYGTDVEGNEVQFTWLRGEDFYEGGIRQFLNGQLLALLPPDPAAGNPVAGVAANLATGDLTIGVQGDCGADGQSTIAEADFLVLSESPHTDPIEAESLNCRWQSEEGGQTVVSWTNADPSELLLVFLERAGVRSFLGPVDGSIVGTTITGTVATDTVLLQFFAASGGFLYGSELIACNPTARSNRRFIRSLCNAVAFVAEGEAPDVLPRPDISSASFLLNFLFLGGPAPVCREACDSDGNREVDISDASYLLNFLFLGGNSPPGWAAGGIGFDPTCEVADAEADCAAGHEVCPP